jgi:hypothetical protein
VVKHLPLYPKVNGLSPVAASGIGKVKMAIERKSVTFICRSRVIGAEAVGENDENDTALFRHFDGI